MRLPRAWLCGVGLFITLAPASRADETAQASWEAAERREYTPRAFLGDGTAPAMSKGRESKAKLDVQAASLETPASPMAALILPRMPHGFIDPTHPVGPAEPGSAAPLTLTKPRIGPASSGHVLMPIRRAP